MNTRVCVYVCGSTVLFVLFFSRVISLLCYPCFKDLCQDVTYECEKNVLEPLAYPQTSQV